MSYRLLRAAWFVGLVCAVTMGAAAGEPDEAETAFAGRVLRPDGSAAAGATVFVGRWSAPFLHGEGGESHADRQRTSVDAAGAFRIERSDLPRDMRMDRRAIRIWAVDGTWVSPSRVLGHWHADARDLELILTQEMSVDVLVRDARGRGVSDIGVDLTLVDASRLALDTFGSRYGIEGTTNDAGMLAVNGLPSGTYVEVEGVGILRDGRTTYPDGRSVALEVHGRRIWVRIDLPASRTVRGRVLEADGTPAKSVLVGDCESSYSWEAEALVPVEEDGAFTLPDVSERSPALMFCLPGGDPDPVFRMSSPRIVAVRTFRPEERRGDVDLGSIVLPARRDVRLTVVDAEGDPLDCSVAIAPAERECSVPIISLRTNERGELTWRGASVGFAYRASLSVAVNPWGEIEQEFDLPLTETNAVLRVTGEGYLLVRLWKDETHRASADVYMPTFMWSGKRSRSGGPSRHVSEFGFWVGAREVGRLRVEAEGFETVDVPSVAMIADAPTVVDVVMRPKER